MFWRWLFRRPPSLARSRERFAQQRPELERAFVRAAASSGKPRGLRWKSVEWQPGVEFAREKQTGQLAALVGVTVAFEAIEGGDMEGLPAVGNLRNASAVFFFHDGDWHTTGKTIFNLSPEDAIAHFGALYERVTPDG
jgi:hypothetical protein